MSFEVSAPPAEVFAYISELSNLSEWDSSVRSVELAHDTGPALGRRFDVVVGFYGRELEAVYEINRFEADAAVGWSIEGKASGTAAITLTETAVGTRVDHRLRINLKGFARLLDRGLGVALEGIGENIERGLTRRF